MLIEILFLPKKRNKFVINHDPPVARAKHGKSSFRS